MEVAESLTDTKISDSAYSNSCSNSQSQRSASLKSRNSGSNSSGSSGYGGKPSDTTSSTNGAATQQIKHAKEKSHKKKKIILTPNTTTQTTNPPKIITKIADKSNVATVLAKPDGANSVAQQSTLIEIPAVPLPKIAPLSIDCENKFAPTSENENKQIVPSLLDEITEIPEVDTASSSPKLNGEEGFCCVISMHDGVVLFTSPTVTKSLGFPKDMWLGRTFMDFMHQKDRDTFTSHIKESLLGHTNENKSTLYLLLRIYRGLRVSGFGATDNTVNYRPFELNMSFREAMNKEQMPPDTLSPADSGLLLVMTATPVQSAYTLPNETKKDVRFLTRHTCNGALSHVDGSAVAACGFLPQDMIGRNVFEFYHPEDLPLLQEIYQEVVEKGRAVGTSFRSKPYRFLVQNGGYATVETEWSSFVNPWSRKLEIVTGLHRVLKGPSTPNVFAEAQTNPMNCISEEVLKESKLIQQEILQLLKEVIVIRRPGEHVKRQFYKRCQALTSYMETLIVDIAQPASKEILPLKVEPTFSERDSVMLGEISPHHESYDSKSSTETPPSYNQLNYNENIQRFFESKPKTSFDEATTGNSHTDTDLEGKQDSQDGGSGSNGSGSGNISSGSNGGGANTHPHGSVTTSGGEASRTGSGSGNGSSLSRPPQLTKAILARHNEDMAKIMVRKHREARGSRAHERKGGHRKGADRPRQNKGQGVKRSGSQSWEKEYHNKASKQIHIQSVPTSGPMITQHLLKNPTTLHAGIPTSFSGLQPNIPNGFRVPDIQHDLRRTLPSAIFHPGLQNIPRPVLPSDLHHPIIHPMVPPNMQQGTRTVINNGSFIGDGMFAARNTSHTEQWSFNTPIAPQNASTSRQTTGPSVIDNPQLTSNMFQPLCYIPSPTQAARPNIQQHNPAMSPFVQYLPGMVYTPHPIFGQPMLYPPFTVYHPMQIPNQGTSGQMQQHYNNIPPDKPTAFKGGGGTSARNEGGRSPKVVRPPSQATSVKAEPGSNVGSIASASVVNRALSECSKRAFPSAYSPDSPIISVQEAEINSRSPSKERYLKEGEDGSYSSYYSSIFKTDNTSMEENEGNMCKRDKHSGAEDHQMNDPNDFGYSCNKMLSSGMKNIDLNADVIHRYQMEIPKLDFVLKQDRYSLKDMRQPSEVNDQLAQLYLELDLKGLSADLGLDDSSDCNITTADEERKIQHLKKKANSFSNLNQIFEETSIFAAPAVP